MLRNIHGFRINLNGQQHFTQFFCVTFYTTDSKLEHVSLIYTSVLNRRKVYAVGTA